MRSNFVRLSDEMPESKANGRYINKEESTMDANKRQRYEKISVELTKLVGGRENIQGVAHCATRLRIVLNDNELADLKAIEDVDLAKGVFVAGDQVQIIFGAGLVNDVYEVFAEHNNMKNMSLSDLKTVANKKMNPLQRIIKALSDVFVDIMPGILAAALLTGLSGVLGNIEFVKANDTLYGINQLINISSGAIFGFLPLAVAYSACKRFGGRPILGIVMGCIMLSDSLTNAYAAAQGTAEVTTLHIFGLGVDLVGFQGGIIMSVFDTKHAICFASTYGTEILIHIGVDTVNLQGKYFTAHVKDGDVVKKGQLLIEFDKEQIEKAGYDTAIPMIFTDLPEEKELKKSAPCKMTAETKTAAVCRK